MTETETVLRAPDPAAGSPRERAPREPWYPAHVWVDLAVLATLVLIGMLGFAAAFFDTSYLVPGIGGIVLGGAVAVMAARWRLGLVTTGLLAVGAFFLLGTPITMPSLGLLAVIPTPQTLAGLAIGSTFGWKDLITLTAPVQAPYYMPVVAFAATFVVTVVAVSVAVRVFAVRPRTPRGSAGALAAPLMLFVVTVLLGTREPYLAVTRGIVFAVIALVWVGWRPGVGESANEAARKALLRRRLVGSGVVVALATGAGVAAGSAASPLHEDRFVLRDEITPPFDPSEFPSPLSGFRKYVKDLREEVLFTVDGLEPGDLIRTAVMDTYDGRTWNVVGPELLTGGSGGFSLVGTELPAPVGLTSVATRSVDVTIHAYQDVWLPVPGAPTGIRFSSGAPATTDLRHNRWTGVLVTSAGTSEGMRYSVDAEIQAIPVDADLDETSAATLEMPPVSNVPDLVAAKVDQFVGDATTAITQLRGIERTMRTTGFLSHGTAADSVASAAGHGADRMKALFERSVLVGDEEQYASAFALMARELGYPARVVMGFAPEVPVGAGAVEVKGEDVTAWVEVAFDGVGWLPFFPTPEETDVPQDQNPRPQSEPQPQVRQPPRNEANQDDLIQALEVEDSEDEDEDEDEASSIPTWVWVAFGGVGGVGLLFLVPMLVIAARKAVRRSRRRSKGPGHRRVAGAWDELVDVCAELGFVPPAHATRIQTALDLERQHLERHAAVATTALVEDAEEAPARRDRRSRERPRRVRKISPSEVGSESLGDSLSSFLNASALRSASEHTWRPGVDPMTPGALAGLRELAVRSDAVFAGRDVPEELVEAAWEEAFGAILAARSSVGWRDRLRARWRFRAPQKPERALKARRVARSRVAVTQ